MVEIAGRDVAKKASEARGGAGILRSLAAAATEEWLLGMALVITIAAFNIPYFQLPYYWDSVHYIAGAAGLLENGLKPLLPVEWDSVGHPILLHEILALAWILLGQSLWVSHLVMAVFAFAAVYYTYRIGSTISHRWTGLIAAVLFLTFPLFRAQSTVVTLDLPATAFAMMAIYSVLKGRTTLYLLSASAMVLSKETAVLFVPAILVYLLLDSVGRRPWWRTISLLAIHALPVLVLAAWFVYHWQMRGWWAPEELSLSQTLAALLPPTALTAEGVPATFVRMGLEYLGKVSLVGLLTLLVLWRILPVRLSLRRLRLVRVASPPEWLLGGPWRQFALLGLPIILYLFFMASKTMELNRYLLPVYPLLFILSAWAIQGVFRRARLVAPVVLGVIAIFVVGWNQLWFGYSMSSPSTLRYGDSVRVSQAVAAYLQEEHPDRTVLAGWPQYVELSMPVQGYVEQPVRFLAYSRGDEFDLRIAMLGGASFRDPMALTEEDIDLIYYSNNTADEAQIRVVLERFQLPMLAEFKRNGAYATIYGRP